MEVLDPALALWFHIKTIKLTTKYANKQTDSTPIRYIPKAIEDTTYNCKDHGT